MKRVKSFCSLSCFSFALSGCSAYKFYILDQLSFLIERYSDLTVDIGFFWIKLTTSDEIYTFVDFPFISLLWVVCFSAITIMWDEVASLRKAWRENDAKTQDDSAS